MKKQTPDQGTVALKPALDIPIRPDNKHNGLINLGRDVHSHLMGFLGIKGAVRLSMSCTSLWVKNQGALFRLFLRENQSTLNNDAFAYLAEAIELDENFSRFQFDFTQLTHVLTTVLPILGYLIRNDLRVAPKFAALCGKRNVAEEILGDKVTESIDRSNHCVASYYSAGGQLECLDDFSKRWPEDFLYHIDVIAQMAAMGGHIHILEYLKNKPHNYDLKKVFKLNELNEETLLTWAVRGAKNEMIDFLLREGLSPTRGIQLALVAASFGHWKLYKRFDDIDSPLSAYLDEKEVKKNALFIAGRALRSGNLDYGLTLMKQYDLDPKKLFNDVLKGGHLNIFWYFINNNFVLLTDRFENETTIEHFLSLYGHLSLLKGVLNDPRPKNGIHAVDAQGMNVLHYAAKGGHFIVYDYCRLHVNPLQKDNNGNTAAHTAAECGSVLFLKRLMLTETGRIMMTGKCAKNNEGETVLHCAAKFGDPHLLSILIDDKKCGLDMYSEDNVDFTVFHRLAMLALMKPDLWNTVVELILKYGPELMDLGAGEPGGTTVRMIMEACNAQKYFPDSLLQASIKKQPE